MTCCRPGCGVAMLVVGAVLAFGDLGRSVLATVTLGWATWVWIAILVVVLLVSFVIVSPKAPETTGEPPP